MEGVPEWPHPRELTAAMTAGGGVAGKAHALFSWVGAILPGVGLAALLAILGRGAAKEIGVGLLGFAKSPLSDISLAILLGLFLRNSLGVPAIYEKGLRFSAREVLRCGIVLLGLKLSLAEAGRLGLIALPVIVVCILTALVFVTRLNRALGLPARLGSLIAVGTSICGISAIAATAPVIEAEEDEVSYAVACVSLFGLLALFVYPYLAHAMFGAAPKLAGIFLGTAIHDTSQVAGAALMYRQQFQAPETLAAATVTKLVRNLCMVVVIPLLGARHRGSMAGHEPGVRPSLVAMVPRFVIGFLVAVVVRTVGDYGPSAFGLFERASWQAFLAGSETLAAWCLVVAMASIGLGTDLNRIRRLGARPFSVGLAAALLVGGVSAALLAVYALVRG
jgi:uncharacterized integral membrane protein (TIGR00698 family)